MKIGITCYPSAGGSGIVATELGQELALKGHQIHFISYATPFRLDRYNSNLMYHSVDMTSYPLFKFPPYTLALASKMAEVTRDFNIEILHVHYAIPHASCAFLAKEILKSQNALQPKIITTLHGTDITLVGSDPSYYDITRFSINSSDGITAVSKYLADETRDVFKITKDVKVIHNFFDDKRFKPKTNQCTKTEFVKDNEYLIAHISNFRPVKRIIDVIDIYEKISKELPSRLLLIGEGPETVLARRQINKKGLNSKVIFLGNQSRVEALLPCVDLFLMPSEEESFGLAALEALACGVPVIGTTGNGLSEVIDDYQNGYLLPVGDTAAMARAGLALLKDNSRLKEFKKNAASIANEKFNVTKIVAQYEKYYEEILNG